MNHVIRTQIIEVATDNSAEAFELQHRLNSLYNRVILPILEKTLDQLAPGDQIIYLDSINIDLGSMTVEELDRHNWSLQFTQLLTREIREAILAQSVTPTKKKVLSSTAQQWLYYMQNGYLPWNVLRTHGEWYSKVLEELALDYGSIEALRRLIKTNGSGLTRIALLHQPAYLGSLVEVLTGTKQSNLAIWMNIIEKVLIAESNLNGASERQGKMVLQMWSRILLYSASVANAGEEEIIRNAVMTMLDTRQLERLLKEGKSNMHDTSLFSLIEERVAVKDIKSENKKNQEMEIKQTQQIEHAKIPNDGIFIPNAGIIILHPFLVQFFRHVGLTNGEKFKNDESRDKALALLHLLTTGEAAFEEHELVIHKILCGHPLGAPVDPHVEIYATEILEAEDLLRTVIEQWSILKNTSIAALRETFLQRGGKLIKVSDTEGRLIVEQDSLDVLLDHLPWALSMVKLPWMTQMLKVDWR